jgi:hypothetical protein
VLTGMTEDDWTIVLKVFAAAQSRRGQPWRNDRNFLEALHFFTVHNLTWRALPAAFGAWNGIWKRFWRLKRRRQIDIGQDDYRWRDLIKSFFLQRLRHQQSFRLSYESKNCRCLPNEVA